MWWYSNEILLHGSLKIKFWFVYKIQNFFYIFLSSVKNMEMKSLWVFQISNFFFSLDKFTWRGLRLWVQKHVKASERRKTVSFRFGKFLTTSRSEGLVDKISCNFICFICCFPKMMIEFRVENCEMRWKKREFFRIWNDSKFGPFFGFSLSPSHETRHEPSSSSSPNGEVQNWNSK